MIRHLTQADYRAQPWANGRGETLELCRRDSTRGMLWRLSVAMVAEDGPFSRLDGIERVLTVIDGPGFDLVGDGMRLRADPMRPLAFAGEAALAAKGVSAPSRDFNLMVARGSVGATLTVGREGQAQAETVALFSPTGGLVTVNGGLIRLEPLDLVLTQGLAIFRAEAPLIAVTLEA
jgi:uncharacterized protein